MQIWDRGATLKVCVCVCGGGGGGGGDGVVLEERADSNFGGTISTFFFSNSLHKFSKKLVGIEPYQPLPLGGPCK